MAEVDPNPQPQPSQEKEVKLKYLDFVQVAALQVLLYCAALYNYAKDNSGPLKPGAQTVEDTVKTVIGPVYQKFHDVPFELLKFVDRKVDSSVNELDRHVPNLVKRSSSKAYEAAQKAPELARAVASEVKRVGVVDTATDLAKTAYSKGEPIAKDLYTQYEPVVEHYMVHTWHSLHKLPLFPQMAKIYVPTMAYMAEKYNKVICYVAQEERVPCSYLPLIPIEKIAKAFEQKDAEVAE